MAIEEVRTPDGLRSFLVWHFSQEETPELGCMFNSVSCVRPGIGNSVNRTVVVWCSGLNKSTAIALTLIL